MQTVTGQTRRAGRVRAATAALALVTLGLTYAGASAQEARAAPPSPEAYQAARILPPGGMADYAAVGRIAASAAANPGGAACTATLVGPDLILTAGHCLPRSPGPAPAARRVFAAGFIDGDYVAQRRGRYTVQSQQESDAVTGLGLLRLDQPIPADRATAIPVAAPDRDLRDYLIVAYRNSDKARPVQLQPCRGSGSNANFMILDCPVVPGNSGAPVLEHAADGLRLVAVITAYTEGMPRQAIATRVPQDLLAVIAAGPAPDGGRRATAAP